MVDHFSGGPRGRLPRGWRGSRPRWWVAALLLVAALAGVGATGVPAGAADSAQELWERAAAAIEADEPLTAARNYEQIHRQFGQSELAQEALWQAAELRRQLAAKEEDPDWQRVRNLYRRYTVEYPDSHRREQAYLELGLAHFQMRFLREALTYFRLFEQRYPDSPLLPRARYWQARSMVEVGALAEALEILEQLVDEPDEELAFDAMEAMARTFTLKGEHREAIATYHEMFRRQPLLRFMDPEKLLDLGLGYFAIGWEEEGRERVFAFINLAPESPRRLQALFALAESRLRQESREAAERLYRQLLEEAEAGAPEAIKARYRLAELQDQDARRQPDGVSRRDPADPAGDAEYQAVIEAFSRQPIAQEARYGLYQRQLYRDDMTAALATARDYIRHAPDPGQPEAEPQRAGELLYFLLSQLLEQGDYERIYYVYVNEHPHIAAYQPGRLKFLVGRAFEELALYRQAAVVYYRALEGAMDDAELPAIYQRRVEVYFALGDYATADILLAHMRRLYAGDEDFLAEVFYLSGRLRQLQRRYDEAREYLLKSLQYQVEAERREEHLRTMAEVLAAIGNYRELAALLERGWQQQWLSAPVTQHWSRRAGDGLRRAGEPEPARKAYELALGEELPKEGEDHQAAAYHLGELLARGDDEQRRLAAEYLQQATAGPDDLLARRAQASVNRLEIENLQAEMSSLFDKAAD